MKKIGIITFHRALNYGAVLQTYALQQYLNKLGIENEIIDYRCEFIENFYKPIKANLMKNPKMFFKEICYLNLNIKKRKGFENFIRKHINTSNIIKNNSDLKELNDKYDCFITGSDQVWNYKWTGFDKNYFLDFVKNKEKYSYAASFGFEKLAEEYEEDYKKLLGDFTGISVREKSGEQIIKKLLGKKCESMLDPTCLLDKAEWNKIIEKPKEKDYILVYTLENSNELIDYAKKLADRTNKKVLYISDAIKKKLPFEYRGFLSPEQFLGLFANADYIITNSFHGMMFSVIFEKQFCLRYQQAKDAPNSRLKDFVSEYGLENSLYENKMKENKEVDYKKIKIILNENLEKSKSYLSILKKKQNI